MKFLRYGLLATVFFLVGCATTVGTWTGGSTKLDATALRADVEQSLVASAWSTFPDATGLKALKPGPGGRRTWMFFTFIPASTGSTFSMVGKSDHVVNWLTFGILGVSLQAPARNECVQWLEAWQSGHPMH